ncbi:hypothetical protein [Pararhizobium sp.]|uniref:hypothetical protein n=1 Tax=Pararhizobium sp. TaxID=1977563 RepID=UPI003D0B4B36
MTDDARAKARAVFEAAKLPKAYLETLSRAELLALGKYLEAMAKALDTKKDEQSELAWLRLHSDISEISEINLERPSVSVLDMLIREDIFSLGNDEPDIYIAEAEAEYALNFTRGEAYRFVDDPSSMDWLVEARKIIVAKLREAGPMSWISMHEHILETLQLLEEALPGHEAYFELVRAGEIETSTADTLSWCTMIRLPDGATE